MVELIWSPNAIAELEAIGQYFERTSPRYAVTLVRGIYELVESIQTAPELGFEVEELPDPELKQRLFQSYRVIYRLGRNQIEIVTILHVRRKVTDS